MPFSFRFRRQKLAMLILVTGLAPVDATLSGQPADDDTIVVLGRLPERSRPERGGQTMIFTPVDATRFDSSAHLKGESSVSLPETGQLSPSGFVIPKIRGHDGRMTDVYLEDILLQDPFTGLTLTDDVDLRAFGQMVLHIGMSPPELPSLNPFGAMQYSIVPVLRGEGSIGSKAGRPHGASVWGLARHRGASDGVSVAGHIFGAIHRTDGRFAFYDDNGTPYNTSDDGVRWRKNNQQRSGQILPLFGLRAGDHHFKLLGWYSTSSRGLPPIGASDGTATARYESRLMAATWAVSFAESDGFALTKWTNSFARNADDRRVSDPERLVLGTDDQNNLTVLTDRGSSKADWEWDHGTAHTAVSGARSNISNETGSAAGLAASRVALSLYAGTAIRLSEELTAEAKMEARQHSDRYTKQEPVDTVGVEVKPERETKTFSGGATLRWARGPAAVYGQAAHFERPPSVIEEFGNGGYVLGSPSLRPEENLHRELGASLLFGSLPSRLGVAVFRDETNEKIIFVPALRSGSRALNIAKTRTEGSEFSLETRLRRLRVNAGLSLFEAYDLSNPERSRRLPGTPTQQAALEAEHPLALGLKTRWTSRYRGDTFRDLANSIKVPPTWIHDLSFDGSWGIGNWQAQTGLSILNVFDVERIPLTAEGGAISENGMTGYGEISGHPLPGRQWRLTASATF